MKDGGGEREEGWWKFKIVYDAIWHYRENENGVGGSGGNGQPWFPSWFPCCFRLVARITCADFFFFFPSPHICVCCTYAAGADSKPRSLTLGTCSRKRLVRNTNTFFFRNCDCTEDSRFISWMKILLVAEERFVRQYLRLRTVQSSVVGRFTSSLCSLARYTCERGKHVQF